MLYANSLKRTSSKNLFSVNLRELQVICSVSSCRVYPILRPFNLVMHQLRHSVQEKNFAGQLASQAVSVKEMLACVGKLGKALDKAFVHTDVCKAKWKDPLHTASLDQVIAQHLFRVGRFDLSEQFSQAASMSVRGR